MSRLLLVVALIVASVAPAWAQSDSRWMAIFHLDGYRGKGYNRSSGGGDRSVPWMAQTIHVGRTILEESGTPFKVFSLPDSGSWAAVIGTPRLAGEADSVWFRRAGCFGWMMTFDYYSSSFDGSPYSSENTAYFTGTGSTKGTFACSPSSGVGWVPGVVFTTNGGAQSNPGQGFFNGIVSSYAPAAAVGEYRTRFFFHDNGDSVSYLIDRVSIVSGSETANVTPIIRGTDYSQNNDSTIVAAWLYKDSCLYYQINATPYAYPAPILLGVAEVMRRAGYTPRTKLNIHIDLDHPFPDLTFKTAPSDSFFAYVDAQPWRFGGPVESHASEIADDSPTLATMWKSRSSKWPGHPHSHNFLNFGNGSYFNFSNVHADSALKAARWTYMHRTISDTLGSALQSGYEKTATFPNNDVMFQDLHIPASSGYRDIRVRTDSDSTGMPPGVNLRRWRRVPSPRPYTSIGNTYGLPYLYVEPKTGKPLYVHDSYEHPVSGDTAWVTATEYLFEVNGYQSRWLNNFAKAAIFDAGNYWHPDLNVTGGKFMADFHRRMTYVYNRISHLVEITPVYKPGRPRPPGGTQR